MEENLADDEIEIELAPISVQLGYVQQVIKYFQYMLLLFIVNLFLFYCILSSDPWKHTRSPGVLY